MTSPEVFELDNRQFNIIYNHNTYNYNIGGTPPQWSSKKKF